MLKIESKFWYFVIENPIDLEYLQFIVSFVINVKHYYKLLIITYYKLNQTKCNKILSHYFIILIIIKHQTFFLPISLYFYCFKKAKQMVNFTSKCMILQLNTLRQIK